MGRRRGFILGILRRFAFLSLFVVLFLGSNILLLTVDAVYDAAKRGLWSLASVATSVGTPTTHRSNREALARLTEQTEILESEKQRLDRRAASLERERVELDQQLRGVRQELADVASENDELVLERARLNGRVSDLEDQVSEIESPLRERVRAINDRLATRTSRAISTNMSSMAIEAVPYAGAAAIVGVTFMEVRDACLTLADTRKMSEILSGEPTADVPACGYTPSEFWAVLRGGPDLATCGDLSDDMPEELRLDCQVILRPGEPETDPGEPDRVRDDDVERPGE